MTEVEKILEIKNSMKLYQHQKEGIKFLKKTKRAILADEMGLGKTAQAIIAAREEIGRAEKIIVVCPASLKINWEREIRIFYEDTIKIISGKINCQDLKEKWIIINYDILEKNEDWINELRDTEQIGAIIMDESHYIKGKSRRAKSAVRIAQEVKRVYCLTGTPLMNRPIELWNQLVAINHPLTIGKGVRKNFSKRYCGGYMRFIPPTPWRKHAIYFWSEEGATHLDELREHLKGYVIRRKKKDVLDLPAKTIDIVEVDLKPENKKEYANAWDDYINFLKENPDNKTEEEMRNILATRQLVEIQKLKQVCARAKIARIVKDAKNIIEQGEKIIIFTQYKEILNSLTQELKKIKLNTGKIDAHQGKEKKRPIKVATLSGGMNLEQRQKAVDEFQNDENTKVFVGNIKAAGVGITLTQASIVIFADLDWTPEIHAQAEDRAHRIGQTGTVNIHYYVCKDTIEEDIIEVLVLKKQIIQEILDGNKKRVKSGSVMTEFLKRMNEKII